MITQIQTETGRHYQTPSGLFPSVTTILDATKSEKEREHLRKWQHKMDKIHGVGSGNTASLEARNRGIKIHQAIAVKIFDLYDAETLITPDLQPYWESVKPIVKAVKNPGYCEHAVYHGGLKYGGTLDLIADWHGLTTIIDWKTSQRTKKLAWINDYTLQITAYAKAYEWLHGVPIQQSLIVIITPEKSQLFQFDLSEIEQHFHGWKQRLEQYYSLLANHNPQASNPTITAKQNANSCGVATGSPTSK